MPREALNRWALRFLIALGVSTALTVATGAIAFAVREPGPMMTARPQPLEAGSVNGVRLRHTLHTVELYHTGPISLRHVPRATVSAPGVSGDLVNGLDVTFVLEGREPKKPKPASAPTLLLDGEAEVFERQRFGFPFHWLTRTVAYDAYTFSAGPTNWRVVHGHDRGLAAANITSRSAFYATAGLLPMGITFVPFVLSLVFYTLALLALFTTTRAVVYTRRANRRRCTLCAYPMDLSIHACPECASERRTLWQHLAR